MDKIKNAAETYYDLSLEMSDFPVDIDCRGKAVIYEMPFKQCVVDCSNGIHILSHKKHRVFPIKFALAELAWILSGSNRLCDIVKFNKAMAHFSDDGVTLFGAYGARLNRQINECIVKLVHDKHTRQAVAQIYDRFDVHAVTKDVPCNVCLQFLIRNNKLNLAVTSRSSDFVTGFPIDLFHWQVILHLVCNEIKLVHQDLTPGNIIYNITSLHVYDSDAPLLKAWYDGAWMYSDAYTHTLYIKDIYTDIFYNCVLLFLQANHIDDVVDIFNLDNGLDNTNYATICNLHELFIAHKNKLVR